MVEKINVINNLSKKRFEITMNSAIAILDYSIQKNSIIFTHTGVPAELEGKGLGSMLVKAGLEYADINHLKVVPVCWFVGKYIEKHPEYIRLL